ncbi:PDZ and LIM domain protein 4 isoform X2 [Frankliniella occidentalis]|uniref:PDZ and LIM domain protein 4 isoform X2 n=1 Tax=Frankliniella occidentalis TaxID=133901 RepID=A0A9C6U200_FRAOC|nr:PDZ and LIM domain protein 4 isoform X2 [Frankliniella occidentalis]
MGGPHVHSVRLHRDFQGQPWGIRLVGGVDLNAPLVITRCQVGSPAEGELHRGDVIRKINEYDSRDLRHKDAQSLFRTAGNTIDLVIVRDTLAVPPSSTAASSRASSVAPSCSTPTPTFAALNARPPVAGGVATALAACLPRSPNGDLSPLPHAFDGPRHRTDDDIMPIHNQPYRTTPLVLPGAKVKKEDNVTDCYLRHHPNPMMRAPPGHGGEWLPADVVMKQKVADTVLQRVVPSDPGRHVINKPFNTPIGLYSEQNIVDTIHKTLGSPLKPTVVYDPAKSETYKFLQEQELGDHVQEVTVPPQPKVFTPNKVPAGVRKINPPPTQRVHQKTISTAPNPYYQVNTMGVPAERIQQSGSFNRLMHMVMNDM